MKYITKKPKGKSCKYFFIAGLCNLLDGLIKVLSFGRYYSSFSYEYTKKQ